MYIGIDLGGTNIAAGLVSEDGKIIKKISIPTNAKQKTDKEIVEDMAKLALRLIDEAGVKKEDINWVGIGSPGSVDNKNGMLVYANNIPFENTPMRAIFQGVWNIPVYIGNDANCAALGEAYAGAAKNCSDAVMITLGTGVGGGIIISKKIYCGFNEAGAELGHMVIVKDGRPCSCGRNGCWEAYSSATALIAFTGEEMQKSKDSLMWQLCGGLDTISGKTAFDAMKKGDKAGQAVVDKYIDYLACGISNIINIFQPEVLCIGGGVCKEGDYLIKPLLKIIEKERYTKAGKQTEIKIAELGNDAGIIGAAMLGK